MKPINIELHFFVPRWIEYHHHDEVPWIKVQTEVGHQTVWHN